MAPRRINTPLMRRIARRERDSHWDFMARLQREGCVHVCLWNKHRKMEQRNELMLCLMGGADLMSFVRSHRPWFGYGAYNQARTTFPFWLTAAGRSALRRRSLKDDLAPVDGGLVDPGYRVDPAPRFHRSLEELRAIARTRHNRRFKR